MTARIGVLGGGQLGRMLGLAGVPLGCSFVFVDPSPSAGASVVGEHVVADYDDPGALERLAECDVVTYEFENVPSRAAASLETKVVVLPPPAALDVTQDRLEEKRLFEAQGVEVAPYRAVASEADLHAALDELGPPLIVKTRREGYDGKGQARVASVADIPDAVEALAGRPAIAESVVGFRRELSLISVRGRDGSIAFYPLVENRHRDGILRISRVPAGGTGALQQQAEGYARAILERLGYAGVLTIEFFERDGALIGNEMAPRVHNSGHWTIEGAVTSQFENHVRAVLGLPLGSTAATGASVMLNLIGDIPASRDVLARPGAHLHLYGKEPRPGRKVGHITIVGDDERRVQEVARDLAGLPGVDRMSLPTHPGGGR